MSPDWITWVVTLPVVAAVVLRVKSTGPAVEPASDGVDLSGVPVVVAKASTVPTRVGDVEPSAGRVLGDESPGVAGSTPTAGVVRVLALGMGPGVEFDDPPSDEEVDPTPADERVGSTPDDPKETVPDGVAETLPGPVKPVPGVPVGLVPYVPVNVVPGAAGSKGLGRGVVGVVSRTVGDSGEEDTSEPPARGVGGVESGCLARVGAPPADGLAAAPAPVRTDWPFLSWLAVVAPVVLFLVVSPGLFAEPPRLPQTR